MKIKTNQVNVIVMKKDFHIFFLNKFASFFKYVYCQIVDCPWRWITGRDFKDANKSPNADWFVFDHPTLTNEC